MKYIGPFLRINVLDNENIKNQLFHLSKEAIANIVLSSGCGIICPKENLKGKYLPLSEDSINHGNAPLLALYRKASSKLINLNSELKWNDKKFKKEINIASNAYMTLCLLELVDYYNKFVDIDDDKYALKNYYLELAGEQLEFYAQNCRSPEGVFIDKTLNTDSNSNDIKLYDKDGKFRFSTQAIFMACYYKYSSYDKLNEKNEFKEFALDILNMLIDFKEDISKLSQDELTRICFGLNIFYKYSNNEDAEKLLLDLSELMLENLKYMPVAILKDNLSTTCLIYINCMILYKHTKLEKFKDNSIKAFEAIIDLYEDDKDIFLKNSNDKECKLCCDEVMLYLYSIMLHNDIEKEEGKNCDNSIVHNIYKNEILSSGLILSWPDAPNLDDVERYRNFSNNSEDLLQDEHFKMGSLPTPENNSIAPVFSKYIVYSRKKDCFKSSKNTFDSYKNMLIFFIILFMRNI